AVVLDVAPAVADHGLPVRARDHREPRRHDDGGPDPRCAAIALHRAQYARSRHVASAAACAMAAARTRRTWARRGSCGCAGIDRAVAPAVEELAYGFGSRHAAGDA